MRVLLDTNVLVAAFATRGLCQQVFEVVLSQHQLVLGETNLTELERVLLTKLRMPKARVQEVVEFVAERAEVVAPTAPAKWPSGDPDDQWVVAAAMAGDVDMVVSGDKDLLDAPHEDHLRVVTPRTFWDSLNEPSA